MKTLIYNVGVSDVRFIIKKKYKDEELFRPNNLYELTKKVYSSDLKPIKKGFKCNVNLTNKKILPIFGLEKRRIKEVHFDILLSFLNFFKESNFKIILLGTSQKPRDNKDTLYLSRILAKFLKSKQIPVEVVKITGNPTDLEYLLSFYSKLVKKYKKDELFFNLTTGTPMQALALALLHKKIKSRLLYKPRDEKVKEVKI